MMNKQVVLILASHFSKDLQSKFEAISKATSGYADVKILFHQKEEPAEPKLKEMDVEFFTNSVLHELGYVPIADSILPGSNHFPVLQFHLQHPDYSYYWCIEDDVNFSSKWDSFFDFFSKDIKHDFISSHLRNYAEHPIWHWWKTLHTPGKDIADDQLMLSFNPIYRISNQAIAFIHRCLQNPGWKGHHEVLIPTLLKDAGYQIADFGTEGDISIPRFSFCTLKSMRWKPIHFITGNKKNLLYHPVKDKLTIHDLLRYAKRISQNNTRYFD